MRGWGLVVFVLGCALLALPGAAAAPAGTTLLVSRPDGVGPVQQPFDNQSQMPGDVSADGRYAVFQSNADGFAEGVDPTVQNLFVRDTQAKTTTLVSRSDGPAGAGADASADNPAIAVAPSMPYAPAGPHVLVVFLTEATNLVDHATGAVVKPAQDSNLVWLRDVTAGRTYLVSKADGATGAASNGVAYDPSIDVGPLGPVVAFEGSGTTSLGASSGVFVRTVNNEKTQLFSCKNNNCTGTPTGVNVYSNSTDIRVVPTAAGTVCQAPAHPNGCVLVAFATADKTVTNDPVGNYQVVVAVAATFDITGNPLPPDQVYVASRSNANLYGDSTSFDASLNADGRAVAFVSIAKNLTADTLPAGYQEELYVRRLDASTTTLASKAAAPAADGRVLLPDLGGDATHLRAVFYSNATNLGGPKDQTYMRDITAGTTSVVSRPAGAGGVPDGLSFNRSAVSADGSAVLFMSSSHNLGDDPGNRFIRVHIRRIATETVELVSRPSGAGPFASGTDGSSSTPWSISADGRYVAFASESDNLSTEDDNKFVNIFVRDLVTGRTTLVSRATGAAGAAADGFSIQATISGDGRRVAFWSFAKNLTAEPVGQFGQSYVRDLNTQTTTLVGRANGATGTPAPTGAFAMGISGDGNSVLFQSHDALDPLAADGHYHVYVRNLSTETTTLADRSDGPQGAVLPVDVFAAAINGDGKRVAWTSQAAIAGAPADGKLRIFLRDLTTGTTTLVSRAEGANGAPANDNSYNAALNAAGDVVAFASSAQNLGVTFPNVPYTQVFVRELRGFHTRVVSRGNGATGSLATSAFTGSLDAAGGRVAFTASGLAGEPTVRRSQVFVRDIGSSSTTLVSRANGAAGAIADGGAGGAAINASGDCVAFSSASANLGDGFASRDFTAVHLRVLRAECPIVPPETTITSGPTGRTRDNTPTFAFTSDDPAARYECKIEGRGFATCSSPLTTAPLPDGVHELAVRGIDAFGHADATPAVRSFTVDTRARLSGLRITPKRVHARGPKRKRGAKIRFRLDRAASVVLTFERIVPGHKVGNRCTTKKRKGRRCTIFQRRGKLTVRGKVGANAVKFSGNFRRKALPAGRYRLTATPARGIARRVTFTVLKR